MIRYSHIIVRGDHMTYQELIKSYPWIDLALELFKGIMPTVVALFTIFMTEFFIRKRNKVDKKREMELQYLEKILSWIHETRQNVFEISSSLSKVLLMRDIPDRVPKLNEVLRQMTEMNKSIFILSDTYKEISSCMGYDFKLYQFKDAIHCYCETINNIGVKYINFINTEKAVEEINSITAQTKESIKTSSSLLVLKINLLYGKEKHKRVIFINDNGEKRKFMPKKQYAPYGFDEKVEYEVYSHIGEAYRKKNTGKKPNNKDNISFDRYSEWEKYFNKKFLKGDYNARNFEHYLNRMHRRYIRNIEVYKAVAIPVYIGEFQGLITIYQSSTTLIMLNAMLLLAIALTIFFSSYSIFKYSNRVNFYTDCIKIVENTSANHQ